MHVLMLRVVALAHLNGFAAVEGRLLRQPELAPVRREELQIGEVFFSSFSPPPPPLLSYFMEVGHFIFVGKPFVGEQLVRALDGHRHVVGLRSRVADTSGEHGHCHR